MAKTYYGYVERDVANQTDWSAITKSMNDMLTTEAKRREDKKGAIDQASREFGKVLTDAEGSSHTGLNEFWLDGANTIQEARRMQDTLLKSGALKYKDYISQRQNLTDGSDELINLVKGFNSKYEAVANDPNASAFDYANLANVQGFGNFTNFKAWANPTDGRISLGKKVRNDVTGQYELSKDPNDFSQVNSLKNRMSQRAAKYDYDAATKKIADTLGRYVKAERVDGRTSLEDVTKSDGYQKMLDDFLESVVANDFNTASILTDGFGRMDYTFNEEEAKSDPKKIYVGLDDVQPGSGMRRPKLTDAQKEEAKKLIKVNLESKLDYIETPRREFDQSQPRQTASERRMVASDVGMLVDINEIMTGSGDAYQASVKASIDRLNRKNKRQNIDSNLIELERGNGAITLKFKEPRGVRTEVIKQEGRTEADVAEELNQYLNPESGAFSTAYDSYVSQKGEFNLYSDKTTPEKQTIGFTEIPLINLDKVPEDENNNKSKSLSKKILNSGGNVIEAAKNVNVVINKTLGNIVDNISIEGDDVSGFTNNIIITLDGEETILKYNKDSSKLLSEVQEIINKKIKEYNEKNSNLDKNGIPLS